MTGKTAGRTTVSEQALHRVAMSLVREGSLAPLDAISVRLSDASGALQISIVVPVVIEGPALSDDFALPLPERGAALGQALAEQMTQMTGRRVGRVDVRYDGVRRRPRRRVL